MRTKLHAMDSLIGRMLSDSRGASYDAATDEDGYVDDEHLDRLLEQDDELEEAILAQAEVLAEFAEAARL